MNRKLERREFLNKSISAAAVLSLLPFVADSDSVKIKAAQEKSTHSVIFVRLP